MMPSSLIQYHFCGKTENAFGIWQGEVWMTDDFNAPLADLQEYM
jgi:hypothetical protein